MPNLPHLILPRAEFDLPRKKTGFGSSPVREFAAHGRRLSRQVNTVLDHFRQRQRPAGIDPSLIMRVQLNPKAGVDEATWERSGLILLSIDENKTLVLFASDAELADFRRRLGEYQGGPPTPTQRSAPHTALFAAIDAVSELRPVDRIGRLFQSQGVAAIGDIQDRTEYVVDVELWDFGESNRNRAKVAEIRTLIERADGHVSDTYVGESLVLVRARIRGALVKQLLEIESVATIDLPPTPTLTVSEALNVGLGDLQEVPPPSDDAPGIAILDSGLTTGHPVLGPAVGEATTIPRSWRDASDAHGHGTMVAGLALYGDVADCIQQRAFVPRLTLYSARVLNDQCQFDDENLITTQMREAIEYFRNTYGCRVFNTSLGDERLPYRGGKVSPWASILDTLAREMDVVIIVSAGNYAHDVGPTGSPDAHLQDYPRYLLDDAARIIEPATGAIVVTVGALSHSANVPPGSAGGSVAFRPIAGELEPSPFTRSGPGLGDAIKPELCDLGGNRAFDGLVRTVRDVNTLSIVSTNRDYVSRLFTIDRGTSFAAPRVAHIAARLLETFPDASANLIRALLASSAQVPQQAVARLSPIDPDAPLRVCGYGRPDFERAEGSGINRVVLYAEGVLAHDNFHIYEIPIPDEFVEEDGTRSISVSLAFDPPVRHTRFDYLGVKMSFRLIRGKSVDEIAEAFRQRGQDEQAVDRLSSTSFECKMEPTPTVREGGTLQKATFTMRRKPGTDYGDTYHLVVRCERKWARDDHGPQRYAVVATLAHSAEINLYNQVRNRVRETVRVRARQRGRG